MNNILQTEQLTKVVKNPSLEGEDNSLTILNAVSFSVSRGESIAIVGASGSGKSTLLGLLAGLDQPSSGTVYLDGQDIFKLDEDGRAELRARLAGFVFQSFQLLPALNALENVMLPLELRKDAQAEEKARRVLEQVGLTARAQHLPKHLSGGEQQRVAIARAFVSEPVLLFADEPTGNLDAATGEQIEQMLFELNQSQQTTLILVTHDSELAAQCQRQIHLEAGEIQP